MAQKLDIDYETTILTLKPDNLGPNKATLLHARTANKSNQHFYKAILYLHGYIDYYFHDHVCTRFLEHGYDFYALDMRKCGRSIISPEQDKYKHYCTDLHEYDEEITLAIEHIIKEAKDQQRKILLFGHSTGGLLATLYASSGSRHADIDAVILNSPYLTAMKTTFFETVLLGVLTKLRKSENVDGGWYGKSIHISARGEWNFDLNKKPIDKIPLHGSFLCAVRTIQEDLEKKRISVPCPVLFMCSNRSLKSEKTWRDEFAEADLILDVITMKAMAATIGPQVTIYEIENAKHDIFLSKQSVREQAFNLMFQWLQQLEDNWLIKTNI
ncbi:unnamed protein product [Adineta steineri]|uniref:Serine aminopeptidase S33 domain-containing protein n=1 Tax=Adineta steineri TaxID=433720 RepID=A0A815GBL3_9BILA|nr:unnamed protein product [Adineta steineri]CAF3745996.1 unnamed protein product [Adineta steineri]